MAILYPLINQNRYDFSSLEMNLAGVIFKGFKSVNYSDKLTPGAVYGTSSMKIGRTRGVYEATSSLEIYKEEFAAFLALPGFAAMGLGETPFVVTAIYADLLAPITTDVLGGCRIIGVDDAHTQGGDPLTVKIDIDPLWISRNGVFLVGPAALLR